MAKLKAVCIGAGYFSQFHYEAWKRIGEVEIMAVCDLDEGKAQAMADLHGVSRVYTDYRAMFDEVKPDFVDVITPPPTHQEICKEAADRGIHVICQKPLAPTLEEAETMVAHARQAGIRMMVHENFRFQPWHREIKKLIDQKRIGASLHSLTFQSRMGDGWGEEAYLGRQPYFRTMPRLLIYETGVHFIDTFQFLAGPIHKVYAQLRKLNPVIAGEDCGLLVFTFENEAIGVWDANRYNESNSEDFRYTFGTFLVEGSEGAIRLYQDGRITIQLLGGEEIEHDYVHERRGFGGDCCFFTQQHFVDCLRQNTPFETSGEAYLNVLRVQEAIYQSSDLSEVITL
ncbi:MAG: Gfo/Idh/MocA family oxidoreductase [Rhodothermaceae bacterium]|nr:Gfo/Idh/MocA family oxidoreductase [Rhodothermaceae bacterium]